MKNPERITSWVLETFKNEGILTEISFNIIFCSDDSLLDINQRFLNHDYYTDIITFPIDISETDFEAEVYISIDRVKENAKNLSKSFENELSRVIIHGVLHLCGYKDKTTTESTEMRSKEDYYLNRL